jgi:prolyl-tRNA editing enzyme YbaK/EbsC (Cys-tRNA(Pro) deacylase)
MSVAAVKEYLKQWGKDTAVREYEASCATVALTAEATGVDPARMDKTLSFTFDGSCVLVVATRLGGCLFQLERGMRNGK